MTEKNKKAAELWLMVVVWTVLRGYVVMLALGILHLQWAHQIPALGLWECVLLSLAFTLAKR